LRHGAGAAGRWRGPPGPPFSFGGWAEARQPRHRGNRAPRMNAPQLITIAVLAGTMALFIWGRLRYDLVAIVALLVALLTGIVTPERAFSGFSDEIVIIVGSALVVSAAIE